MKRLIFLAILSLLPVMSLISYAQDKDCKVLMQNIGDFYDGDCRRGLAEGNGKASGIDSYNGHFRKGLPDGQGTYIWATGEKYTGEWKKGLREGRGIYNFKSHGRDTVITGIWREDKYMGEKIVDPYVIEYRNSIGRVSCMRVGDRPYVKYVFSRNGAPSNGISNLLLQGSSGSEKMSASFTGFEQVEFPFKGKVSYQAPNSWMSAILNCELRIVINEPGSWVVTMFY